MKTINKLYKYIWAWETGQQRCLTKCKGMKNEQEQGLQTCKSVLLGHIYTQRLTDRQTNNHTMRQRDRQIPVCIHAYACYRKLTRLYLSPSLTLKQFIYVDMQIYGEIQKYSGS